MAMRRSPNLHTMHKAEVVEHLFPPEMSKFCMAIIFPFYNISS